MRTPKYLVKYQLGAASLLIAAALVAGAVESTAAETPLPGRLAHYDAAANASCQPLKVFEQPAAGFDPLTATNAELQNVGFPPRPSGSDPGALVSWTTDVTSVKRFVAPQPICSSVLHTVVYSGFWAGHVVPNSLFGGAHFTTIQSNWIQPAVAGNPTYPNWLAAPDTSFWTGIGNSNMIQAGADSISSTRAWYLFWTEDYPAGTVWEGPAINPGDKAAVYVRYEGNNVAYYFLEDLTTGDASPFTNPAPYVGYSAANYINERLNGLYLPQFSQVAVTNNFFGDSTDTWQLTTSNNKWVMTSNCQSSGSLLSSPSGVASDGSFTQNWYSLQPYTNGC